jgi:streptogramin lyase
LITRVISGSPDGQNGIYGRLDTKTGAMAVFDAPRGTGPYGIATTLPRISALWRGDLALGKI